MKSREVSGRDTRTGGLCADEVLDTETRQSAAAGQESPPPQPAPDRKAKRSQQWNSPLKMHRLTRQSAAGIAKWSQE